MKTDKLIVDVKDLIEGFKKNFFQRMIGCDYGILILKKIGEVDYYHSIPIYWNETVECDHKKLAQLRAECRKKVLGLCKLSVELGHISSVQGRCESNHARPGAIVSDGGWVCGFAGLPDHMSELLITEAVAQQEAITPVKAAKILELSHNVFAM